MSNKILTVSIAAYNMEAYLHRTLDSLIDERVIDDLEVFVVDDGSTDRTLEIAQDYVAKYPNSIFAIHKENGGYGTTVNCSIARATGKYFKLLDGDDWFDTGELVKLVIALRSIEADFIYMPYKVYKCNSVEYIDKVGPMNKVKSGSILTPEIFNKKAPAMWDIAFKTEVVQKSGMKLPERRLYTDMVYLVKAIAHCEDAIYLDYYVYNYFKGREGQSSDRKIFALHFEEWNQNLIDLFTFYEQEKKKNILDLAYAKRVLQDEYLHSIRTIMRTFPLSKENLQYLKDYENKIGLISPDIYNLEDKKSNKYAVFIKLCRKTNYVPYWLLKLVPERLFMIYQKLLPNKEIRKVNMGGVTENNLYCPVIACCAGTTA